MDYEKAYKQALERARKIREEILNNEILGFPGQITEIFPELAESESEDEKIREALIRSIEEDSSVYEQNVSKEQMLSWLEKQKDLMPPTHVDPCDASWYAYYQRGLNKGYELGLEAGMKEQKPSIFPPGLGEVHWNPIPSGKDVHKWNLPEDFEEAVYKVANFISPFDSQEELRRVSHRFAEQLMSLAKKELIKKPVEWSEEDKKMIERLITRLNWITYNTRTDGTSPNITFFDEIAWLKSLRPVKQELSEKDRKILDDVSHILAGLNYKQVAQDYKQAVENLLSLRRHWKPTEEQMTMLRAVLNDPNNAGAESCQLALSGLYEQLKKL